MRVFFAALVLAAVPSRVAAVPPPRRRLLDLLDQPCQLPPVELRPSPWR